MPYYCVTSSCLKSLGFFSEVPMNCTFCKMPFVWSADNAQPYVMSASPVQQFTPQGGFNSDLLSAPVPSAQQPQRVSVFANGASGGQPTPPSSSGPSFLSTFQPFTQQQSFGSEMSIYDTMDYDPTMMFDTELSLGLPGAPASPFLRQQGALSDPPSLAAQPTMQVAARLRHGGAAQQTMQVAARLHHGGAAQPTMQVAARLRHGGAAHPSMHADDKPFKCRFKPCKMAFRSNYLLKRHECTHTGEKPFKCAFEGCGAAFVQSYHLIEHTRRHTGEKPFKCAFEGCGAAFVESSELTVHMRRHNGEKPFKCAFEGCGAAFVYSSALTIHVRRQHTGQKPFTCNYVGCAAAFAVSSDLTAHIRIHTGEKPFTCKHLGCQEAFAQSSGLAYHMRTHHQENG